MNVLFLNPGAQMGGAETSLVELLSGIREMHPDWNLHLLLGEEGPLVEQAQRIGCVCHVLPLPTALARAGDSGLRNRSGRWGALGGLLRGLLAAPGYAWRYRGFLKRLDPQLVHATGLKMQVLAALVRPAAPLIWHIHDYVSWRPVARRLLRLLASRCRLALVNSCSVEADLRQCCPGLRDTKVLYNAVDVEELGRAPAAELDALAGLSAAPAGTLRVGLVATYARWKGHDVFLEALARLPADLPWRAYIIGGPIYRTAGSQFSPEELRERIAQLSLRDRVGLTGFIADRGAAMRALDIVVHASTKPEPFGMVVIEAMASRRPVVVSAAGGALELCQEESTGLGHIPGDSQSLATQIERLMRDPNLAQRLVDEAFRSVEQKFSRAKLSGQLSETYRQVLGAVAG